MLGRAQIALCRSIRPFEHGVAPGEGDEAQARFCGAEGIENVVSASGFRSSFGDDYGMRMSDGPLAGLAPWIGVYGIGAVAPELLVEINRLAAAKVHGYIGDYAKTLSSV